MYQKRHLLVRHVTENPPEWKIYQPWAIRDDFLCYTECVHMSLTALLNKKQSGAGMGN